MIAGTFPGTPAYGVLNVGDVVTAVDGTHHPHRVRPWHKPLVPLPLGADGDLHRAQERHRRPGAGAP